MARLGPLLRGVGMRLADGFGRAGVGRWLMGRRLLGRALPPEQETLNHAGCSAPVEVRFDRSGIPHIYAASADDVFFGQGYCHARDRLWQMEVNRRLARGELSEMFGPRALDLDRFLRRMSFRHTAEKELSTLDPIPRAALEAYARGANAYLTRHPRPVEFLLLRAIPRPWDAVDSLAFARYMGWSLTHNWETELVRQRLIDALGPEQAAALEPSGGGSNAWVVSGARSATGRPILANDPHLRPRLPAQWYLAHLCADDLNVIGATLPGAPGVLIGHNDQVAWGITVAEVDCQDFFIEKPDPDRPGWFAAPEGHGAEPWYPAEVRRESIYVKGVKNAIVERVGITRHGPLLQGVLDITAPLALRWVADELPSPMAAILKMNRAASVAEFRTALESWLFPTLNFMIADTAGSIGYQLAGRVPLRAKGDGRAPVPGWDGQHEWTGTVPFTDLPHAVNPAEGILASANGKPEFMGPHELTRDWMDSFRQQRALTLLRSRERHSRDDMADMQRDLVSLPALQVAQKLCASLKFEEFPQLAYLKGWDGRLGADSVAATLYQVFRVEFLRRLHRDLPKGLLEFVEGQGISEALAFASVFHCQGSRLLLAKLDALPADSSVIADAFRTAIAWLTVRLGPDPATWLWGRLHTIVFTHVLGAGAPALDRLLHLSRGPLPIGGDVDTLAQQGVDPWRPYTAATFSVSYRQILDVGNWDESWFSLPLGQSGQPGSPHYDDLLEDWRTGNYRPLLFSRSAVEQSTGATIQLRPN